MTIKQLLQTDVSRLCDQARSSPRRRAHKNFHLSLDEPVQRVLMAMQLDSYVRPHRHTGADRWEFVLIISGAVVLLIFSDAGEVRERVELQAGGDVLAYELAAGEWHTLAALKTDTVVFEFKPGPYSAATDKDFATWAPVEGKGECAALLAWYRRARVGEKYA